MTPVNWVTGHFLAFVEVAALLCRYRQLTWEMTRREITDRYVGQLFGTLWGVGHPLVLICVYVFVFGYVFKLKVGGTFELPLDYTAYMLSGLLPWIAFQEAMNKSAVSILGHSNLVKQVVFPVEILPVKGVIAAIITQLIGTTVLVLYVMTTHGRLHLTYFLLPVVLLLQTLAMIGVSFVLSSIGVYFRDMKEFVQVFCTIGVFIIPVVYLPDQVPQAFRPLIYANPFSHMVWCYQDVLFYGRIEHPWAWVAFSTGAVVIFVLGYRVFRSVKIFFGNVL